MKKMLFQSTMYVIALTLVFWFLPSTGFAYNQQTPVKKVLDEIAAHHKVNFLYENNLLQNKYTSYRFNSSVTLQTALRDLLTPLGLKFSRLDEKNFTILAIKKNPIDETSSVVDEEVKNENALSSAAPFNVMQADSTGKEMIIKGRVVSDEKEQPIPNASVMARNSRLGTTTDAEGYFTLKVPSSIRTLTIGHVNFNTVEIPAGPGTPE